MQSFNSMEPIIFVAIFAAVMGMMLYSLILQKAATKRQARNTLSVQESMERQREANQLMKESNQLLTQILDTLKGKKDG